MFRRSFLHIGAGAAIAARVTDAHARHPGGHAGHGAAAPVSPIPPSTPAPRSEPVTTGQVAVVTPDGVTLPWRLVDGVKVGHLIAEEIEHAFAPGLGATVWGYNGRTPGPTIEAVEGDRVRIYVTNRLREATTVHWHGILVPNGMDGVAGLNQPAIAPGQTFRYEFTLRRPGTFMYHSHFDEMVQIALGMVGMFVVHPRRPSGPRVDRDFVLMTHEWRLEVGASRPDPFEMTDFNLLTFNSKSFPGTQPMLVGRGERVRIRLGNLGPMDHHPIHLHGVSFKTTATDGGFIPPAAQVPASTVLVPVGSTRVIEFVPEEPGDWAVHCHMTHHMMTQMGHDIPSMIGADTRQLDRRMRQIAPGYMTMGTTGTGAMTDMHMPVPPNSLPMRGAAGQFGAIDLGGMVTVLKVRDAPSAADVAGPYRHPPGTVAAPADPERLVADGIDVGAPTRR